MAAGVLTPIDEVGMPLPLAPLTNEELNNASLSPDWHHHFHPRRSPLLAGKEDGGLAVRNARLQLYNYNLHHINYHNHFTGPQLPETREARFGLVVLATAGYVPPQAIGLRGDTPEVIELSRQQRLQLWEDGNMKIAGPEVLREFLVSYTLSQAMTDVDVGLIDQLIHTANKKKRYLLGGKLLDLAIERAAEPLIHFIGWPGKKVIFAVNQPMMPDGLSEPEDVLTRGSIELA
jgi:hypothetical protein